MLVGVVRRFERVKRGETYVLKNEREAFIDSERSMLDCAFY